MPVSKGLCFKPVLVLQMEVSRTQRPDYGPAGSATTCDIGIPDEHQFESQLFHFLPSSLLMRLGQQQKTWTALQAPGFGLAQPSQRQPLGE